MKTIAKPLFLFAIILNILLVNPVIAESAEQKGLNIAIQVERRDSGWHDAITRLNMVLKNQHGETSTRSLRMKILEVKNDGDKSLILFDTPRDLKGTGFLSFSHALRADEQWLYLPALKRVKRISSANKSGPFMSSQFAYEDLSSFEVEKYSYKYLYDKSIKGNLCFVVETTPKYKYSGYSRQLVWIDQKRYIPLQVHYYDRKNTLLKILTLDKYKNYLNTYWRSHYQTMKNVQNGKVTLLSFDDFQFQTGLNSSDFSKNSLKNYR